jgi:cell division protein FtsA
MFSRLFGSGNGAKARSQSAEQICAIDVGTTKICALIAELDDEGELRVIGAGRVPSKGLRRGVVINTNEAKASVAQAVIEAETTADRLMREAYVGISGTHINAIGSKGVAVVGRNGRYVTREDTQRALDQARNIALAHNREIIHAVPRSYTLDEQRGILEPIGMFGYRLEVDASIITGAASAIQNLVNVVHAHGVQVLDLVLQPLASAEAVLTDDERRLGVALVDIGGGTTDMAIYLEGSPWHTQVMDVAGEHFIKDVAQGLRMPFDKAEALIKRYGHVLPDVVPYDAEVRWDRFGQQGQQTISRRMLAEILNARANDVVELILREVKRSGYDGILPAGVVLTGGVSQLNGILDLSQEELQWPVRLGRPEGVASSVIDLSSPEFATSVGLLLWGLRRGTASRVPEPKEPTVPERIRRWLRGFLPGPS